ncbi:chloride channel protein [Desulfohalovibrio reitneri]|uniref:chloride channel protein n=1 Tax=Desulfohalovibrio reitneri TaxID=1307759 RepID=UPI0009DE4808|nr:chloride channel protein [Desulfohalovibrio reitneri]
MPAPRQTTGVPGPVAWHGAIKTHATWLFYFASIGLISGLGAIAFHTLTELGMHYFLDTMAGYRPSLPAGEHPLLPHTDTPLIRWMLLVLPTAGGLVSGWLVYTFAPEAEGHGTDAAIEAYHNKGGIIRGRVPIIKTIASTITLTTGGSGGREGPIAQIGAGFGSFLASKLKLSERERRIMLAAGVGAGVGAIFRAPLAGALFASEVLYSEADFESEVLIPAGISSVVAYCTFCLVFGWGSLFAAPEFSFSSPLELGPYAVLAGVLLLGGWIYSTTFYKVHDAFGAIPIPSHVKPAIGGLLTGVVGFFLPETLAFGYGVLQGGLFNELPMLLLLGVAGGKILTTAFTIGSGGSGGVFGPSVVIGGCLGGAVGQVFQLVAPALAPDPGAMVLVGMAGFFTAVSATPVSTIIFVSEMTNSYSLLLPSLLVCFLCQLLSRSSIYREQVANKFSSPAHAGEMFTDILQEYTVRDMLDRVRWVEPVPEDMSFRRFKRLFTSTDQHYFPVLDDKGGLTGIFSANDVRAILLQPHMDDLINMRDLARSDIIKVTPREDLGSVMRKLTQRNLDALPVVRQDDPQALLGMLGRREAIAFYNEKMAELRERE